MAQIIKLPAQAPKLGYKRVKRRARTPEDPDQLNLFASAAAEIIQFSSRDQSAFEQALALDERGDPRASELYATAIAQQDCVADAYCNLGILESQKGQTVRAIDCFSQALKHEPRHCEAHYNLANLYFDQNDFRIAQLHFELAAEFDPNFANALFNLILVQAINGEPAAARITLAKFQKLASAEESRLAGELLETLEKSPVRARSAPPLGTGRNSVSE